MLVFRNFATHVSATSIEERASEADFALSWALTWLYGTTTLSKRAHATIHCSYGCKAFRWQHKSNRSETPRDSTCLHVLLCCSICLQLMLVIWRRISRDSLAHGIGSSCRWRKHLRLGINMKCHELQSFLFIANLKAPRDIDLVCEAISW